MVLTFSFVRVSEINGARKKLWVAKVLLLNL